MNTFLPPQEVEQVNGLFAVLADPDKYKALVKKLDDKDKALTEQKLAVSKGMDNVNIKLADLETREDAMKKAWSNLDTREAALATKQNDLDTKTATVNESLMKQQKTLDETGAKLREREENLLVKEAHVSSREIAVANLEIQHKNAHQDALDMKAEYDAKLKKLKAIL